MDNITRLSIIIILLAILFVISKGILWLLKRLGYVFSKKRISEFDKRRAENIQRLEDDLGIRINKLDKEG